MNLCCRSITTILAASAWSAAAFAQAKLPSSKYAIPATQIMGPVATPPTPHTANTTQAQPKILWIRNDKTGQVIKPGNEQFQAGSNEDPAPVTIFNTLSHAEGWSPYNLNWNYSDIYTNPDFTKPVDGPNIAFRVVNIQSDPSGATFKFNDEPISLLFEPWTAATWPVEDLNAPQPLKQYASIYASMSEQFEIRMCRIYFFSLADVNLPFNEEENPYQLETQLSFGFLSYPYQDVATPIAFNLQSFNPPFTTKARSLILTHWLRLSVPPPCEGDLNGDGLVDDADFSLFIRQYDILDCYDDYMPEFCSADLNFDDMVDDADFSLFVVAYNNLLCPEASVVRNVYAPFIGGRVRWNNPDNQPWMIGFPAASAEAPPWPHPNTLLTIPSTGGIMAESQPSFSSLFTTKTAFGSLADAPLQEDLPTPQLKAEYERFLNWCANRYINTFDGLMPVLSPFMFYDSDTVTTDPQTTEWFPNTTPKLIQLRAPSPPQ